MRKSMKDSYFKENTLKLKTYHEIKMKKTQDT